MKRILIPTDFSSIARRTLDFAVSFFETSGIDACLILVNIFPYPGPTASPWVELHDRWKTSAELSFQHVLGAETGTPPLRHVQFETLSFIGSIDNVLTHLARERRVDCVILGMPQEPRQRAEWMRVLDRVSCPVLLIPPEAAVEAMAK